jgi:DNA repair exonuclease SbcCD ATPase subunit
MKGIENVTSRSLKMREKGKEEDRREGKVLKKNRPKIHRTTMKISTLLFLTTSAAHTMLTLTIASRLREGASVQMYDSSGKMHAFRSRLAAQKAGMLVGHFPDVDSCHSACEAAKGCGHDQECLCNCCDVGAMENDGCFCFSCGPIGKPITFWSEHHNVNPRSNPLDSSEEPDQCTGSMQMCGGMFGDTSRGQETQDQREARLEKQAKAAAKAKADMEKKLAEMAKNQQAAEAAQAMANKAISQLQSVKDDAEEKTKQLEATTEEVGELENKMKKEQFRRTTKEKEADLLKIQATEQKSEIETLKQAKKKADEKAVQAKQESELAEAHAHALAKEVENGDPANIQVKADAKLLEAELKRMKDAPIISLGPTDPPKELNNVQPFGEQLLKAETAKNQEKTKDAEVASSASDASGTAGVENEAATPVADSSGPAAMMYM